MCSATEMIRNCFVFLNHFSILFCWGIVVWLCFLPSCLSHVPSYKLYLPLPAGIFHVLYLPPRSSAYSCSPALTRTLLLSAWTTKCMKSQYCD
ncbi:hypothetical protein XENTR_v10018035 [Xenopus tropicalis]|nr:hypothetical protein XENTR_v10018035 [Xenopus tropicalis]